MKILAIACVEDFENIKEQISKQTIKPTNISIVLDEEPAKGIENRRKRIAENQERLRKYVEQSDAEYIWQLEGDSVLPDNCLERLIGLSLLHELEFISGVQVGRHGIYCLGAWTTVSEDKLISLDPKLSGLQQVLATGLYCLLTTKEKWLEGLASYNGEVYGPDVNWCLSIDCEKYVDLSLEIGHKIKGGIINPSDEAVCQVEFSKINNKWEYKTN